MHFSCKKVNASSRRRDLRSIPADPFLALGIGVGSRGSAQKQGALMGTPSFLLHRGVGAFLVPQEEVNLLEKTPSGLQKANLALLAGVAAGQMSAHNNRLQVSPVL